MKKRGNKKFKFETKRTNYDSEIVLLIEDYENIYSDFDIRPYSHRALSADFLDELKRASMDKSFEKLDLKLLITKDKRNTKEEAIIEKRLNGHFNHHYKLLLNEKKVTTKKGTLFVFFGILIMVIATYVLFYYGEKDLITTFLVILLEPGGWFLFWEGLDLVLFGFKHIENDLNFYKKMAKCDVTFYSY